MAGESPGLLPVVPVMRVDDGEVGDAHIHHGSADRADISRALGFNEYDSDVFEWIHDSSFPIFHGLRPTSNLSKLCADGTVQKAKGRRMNRKNIVFGLVCIALLAGCSTVRQRRAMVDGRVITNPSLGFFGFSFEMPEEFDLFNPAVGVPDQYGEIQQLAIRIYNLNRAYHPRGNESFYDSFLMLSEKTGVLLMTLKMDIEFVSAADFFAEDSMPQVDLIPLYNVSGQEVFELGKNRAEAVYTRGHAYEHKGWYYAEERRQRQRFQYEACKVSGGNRDHYVLLGFCLPGDEKILKLQVQEMMRTLQF